MGKRTTNFLNISLILISFFCIFVFVIQTICMNLMGENAIRQLCTFYMSGISEQVASHFGTTIELRLSQVESLVDSVPPGRFTGETAMRIGLTYNARSAGFEYLAFYTDDGQFHMIYGAQVTADVPESLDRSVRGGRYNVCAGKDRAGIPVVLMGVPAVYPMGGGNTSIALVAGLPTSYLSDILEDNVQSSMMEYSIIRDDGSYVLHKSPVEAQNYFERVEKFYETCNGKEPSQYAREFRQALEADRDYSDEVLISGEDWNIYCSGLPNSEWHLLLKVSHNTLNETVTLLQKRWSCISIGGCSLIILSLLLVFFGYYRLTKTQMRALDEARKTAEEAMRSAERSNRAKNEFLSNMSHDIRTPMNGIMGMTSIAISSLDNPPRVRSCLKKIHVSSRHLLGLISDMLDMSKIESGDLILNTEDLCLRDIMQNIAIIIQDQVQEKRQHFHIYVHGIFHENVRADRVRLSQILLNIIGNAVKFTPEGGTIEADLYEEPSPKGQDYIRSHLHIKDNGIGMSREFQSKIFDAFAREDSARVKQAAGAGMGMAITKYIVDSMGGAITVESQQGDDKTAGLLAVSALESIGLRGEAVTDMNQAFQVMEDHCKTKDPYDIILLDWDIQGQDGIQAARELALSFGPELPVILLTDGEWDEIEAEAGHVSSIRSFISKPLFRSSLYYGLRPFTQPKEKLREQEEESSAEAGIDLKGRRILVAEDNELNWEIASEMLSDLGMELEWAENGQICVEKFEQSPPGWYDAILMDLRMPVMTGFEAAKAIRESDHSSAGTVPIIAVSADAFQEDIRKCLDCGMNAHTAKPFDLDEVLSLLRRLLHWERNL